MEKNNYSPGEVVHQVLRCSFIESPAPERDEQEDAAEDIELNILSTRTLITYT